MKWTPVWMKNITSRRIQRNKKRRKLRNTPRRRLLAIISAVIAFLAILSAGLLIYFLVIQEKPDDSVEAIVPQITMEALPRESKEDVGELGKGILNHIFTAGEAVSKSYEQRPPEHELTAENTATFATGDCKIDTESGQICVTATADGIPISDDKFYYLFAMNTYDNSLSKDADYISKEYKDSTTKLYASINYNLPNSRLFKKFVVAVKLNNEYVPVCTPQYITNPEAIAKYSSVFVEPASIKGLLVDPNRLRGGELDDLGVKQAAYNIPLARLLGPTTSSVYPTQYYTYNGKTYTLNGQVIAEYDIVFSTLTAKGISTTAILLNNYSSSYIQLIHPNARSGGSAPYYMFNGAEESGVECMAAISTFLAERYSDNKHGKVSSWIIANEINARKEWNYMEYTDVNSYVEEYAKAFRVFYTAIKSVSGNAKVYISIDQQWDRNIKNNKNYDGRDVLDSFNKNIKEKGNLDWGVAQHPYNVPLTEARIWKSSKYVKHTESTSMITMENIDVLVNYLRKDTFRQANGEVRSITLSELGYTSNAGEANQAAAYAYAYYKMEAYDEIDAFLLNRQTDAPEEVAQGLSFGLNHVGGGQKQIYTVFKYIDTPERDKYTDFAKKIIGISSWGEIIK